MERRPPLSLYVHIPFCAAKCRYCDFNSYAGQESLVPAYTQALLREAEMWSAACSGWRVDTLFFGGGTPSLMPLPEAERLLDGLLRYFQVATDAEVTLEANPGTVDKPYLSRLRELGVSRLSLGVQSFHDDELAFLGRVHSARDAREAYRAARDAGFDSVGLDLIFGLPGQTAGRWLDTLEEAIGLGPEHLSLYALTVEDGTPLGDDVAKGRTPPPDPDLQADLYSRAAERLEPAGYDHYEISNWARPGYQCRHNLTYWRNGFWLGLGAGAHSHLPGNQEPGADGQQATSNRQQGRCSTCVRFAAEASPARYVELVNETWERWSLDGPLPLEAMRQITFREETGPPQELSDTLVLGLRLSEGVSLQDLRRRFGRDAVERHAAAFEEATCLGLLEPASPARLRDAEAGRRVDGRLRLTARGRLLANEVFVRLLPAG